MSTQPPTQKEQGKEQNIPQSIPPEMNVPDEQLVHKAKLATLTADLNLGQEFVASDSDQIAPSKANVIATPKEMRKIKGRKWKKPAAQQLAEAADAEAISMSKITTANRQDETNRAQSNQTLSEMSSKLRQTKLQQKTFRQSSVSGSSFSISEHSSEIGVSESDKEYNSESDSSSTTASEHGEVSGFKKNSAWVKDTLKQNIVSTSTSENIISDISSAADAEYSLLSFFLKRAEKAFALNQQNIERNKKVTLDYITEQITRATESWNSMRKEISKNISQTSEYRTTARKFRSKWENIPETSKKGKTYEELLEDNYTGTIINKYTSARQLNNLLYCEGLEELLIALDDEKLYVNATPITDAIDVITKACVANNNLPIKYQINMKQNIASWVSTNTVNCDASLVLIKNSKMSYMMREKITIMMVTETFNKISNNEATTVPIIRLQPDGAIKVKEQMVVVYDAEKNVKMTVNLAATQIVHTYMDEQPDDFIRQIKAVAGIVIVDTPNMHKAMKNSMDQIEKFCEYLQSWAITVVEVVNTTGIRLKNSTYSIIIDDEQHDDITQNVLARVHSALMLTSDSHSEFKEFYSVCETHNYLITRKGETCVHATSKNDCIITVLKKRIAGKVVVKNIITDSVRVTSFKSTKPVVNKGNVRLTNATTTYHAKHPMMKEEIARENWPIHISSLSGSMGASSQVMKHYTKPITVVTSNIKDCAKIVMSSHSSLALVETLLLLGDEGMAKIKSMLKNTLTMQDGYLTVINKETNEVVGMQEPLFPTANMIDDMEITVASNFLNLVMKTNNTHKVSTLNTPLPINSGFINLDNCTMYFNEQMLQNLLILVQDCENHFILLIDELLAQTITKNAVEHLKKHAIDKGKASYALPLTAPIRDAIAEVYKTDFVEAEHEGISWDRSMFNKYNPVIQRYFTEVDADRPSRQLIAAPDSTTSQFSNMNTLYGSVGNMDVKLRYYDRPVHVNYMNAAVASYLWSDWDKLPEVKDAKEVVTCYINVNQRSSVYLRQKDIDILQMALHEPVTVVERDVIRDVLNVFRSLSQGYKQVVMPPIVRAIYMPNLGVAAKAGRLPIAVTYSLPTCSIIAKLVLDADPMKSFMVLMVQVAPPVTHSYVAAKLNSDIFLQNEYSMILCDKVSEETLELFQHLDDKWDYVAFYLTAYNTYSLGLRLLGLDPISIILENSSVIETGNTDIVTILSKGKRPMPITKVLIREFIYGICNKNSYVVYKPTMIKGKWDKARETHAAISTMIEMAQMPNYEFFVIAYQISAVLLGAKRINKHLMSCYKSAPLPMESTYQQMYDIISKLGVKHLRCPCNVNDTEFLPSGDMPPVKLDDARQLTILDGDTVATFDPNSYKSQPNRFYIDPTTPIGNYIPLTGKVIWMKINNANNQNNKFTRNVHVSKMLQNRTNLYIDYHNVRLTNATECFKEFGDVLSVAHRTGSNVMVTSFDKFPSWFKMLKQEERRTIIVPPNIFLYVPDALLYAALKHDVRCDEILHDTPIVEMTSETDTYTVNEDKTQNVSKWRDKLTPEVLIALTIVVLLFATAFLFWNKLHAIMFWPKMVVSKVFGGQHATLPVVKNTLWNLFGLLKQVEVVPKSWLMTSATWAALLTWWTTLLGFSGLALKKLRNKC